ncbi:MAG: hypothetical protein JST00_33385 [Deltaproteobacteria bacterium]|nr:hypothetical protein [Deltaproteobacteria bacterium]
MKARRLLVRTASAFVAAGALLCGARAAHAMAPPPCMPATVTPSTSGIVIPANIPGFGYTATKALEKDVRLFSTTGTETEIALAVGPVDGPYLKVAPKTTLVPGNTYRLEYSPFCTYGATTAKPITFTAGAEAPLPTRLADLVGTPTVVTKDFGTTQFAISALFAVAAEMKPWLEVYQVALSVDGRLVSTTRAPGANDSFTVNATGWCDAVNASRKTHTVQLKGRLPFAPSVESAATELAFDCPAPKVTTAPPYTGPTGGPGGSSSGGTANGSSGASTPGTPGTAASGGCTITAAPRAASPLALGIAALAMAARRVSRRRRA